MKNPLEISSQLKTSAITSKLPFATLESSRSLDVLRLKQALINMSRLEQKGV
jgi:hypothetical protein